MRIRIYVRILIAGMVFLAGGLFYVQIIKYDQYRVMSEENRLKVIPLMAPRGNIYDRNGEVLVKDDLSFDVSIIYGRVRKYKSELVDLLSGVLEVGKGDLEKRIDGCKWRPYSPMVIVKDIGAGSAIRLEEIASDYSGLLVQVSTKRRYIHGKTAANVIGYLGLINRSELERLKPYGYRINDLMGRSGIEKQYDNYLRGIHGGKQIEVDHLGREVLTIGYKEPVPGRNVFLTIDYELQAFCEDLLSDKKGAIVVLNPENGAVLAMASAPSYDPGIFIDSKKSGEVGGLLKDADYPLINRAISGVYPPGSVFKLVIAAAALETKKATAETSAVCEGAFTLGRKTFKCWKKSGHGYQEMTDAIKNSCNVYFYRLGLLVGVDDIAKYAKKFGFGHKSGIDIPGESTGIVPSRAWKKKRFKDNWYKGETVNYAIGQGYLLVTPLQIARMMSVFANRGYLVKPYLVDNIGGIKVKKEKKESLGMASRTIDIAREGLKRCVNDKRGTGMKARQSDIIVAGKTGTAQTSRGKNHGWFAGFAPFEKPRLTVVVFDEHGGKGGYYAAETAGKVFKEARRLGII